MRSPAEELSWATFEEHLLRDAADRPYENDVGLVVEVSSPSTVDVDRREKAAAYAKVASLRLYILVDPDSRRLEVVAHPGGRLEWQAFGPGTVVPTRYGDLGVDDLYDALDASATT